MSTSLRLISAFFTCLPAFGFLGMFLASRVFGGEYYWLTYLGTLTILVMGSLLFGFALPSLFRRLKVRQPWIWILVQGLLAWIIAWFVLGVLNMTPLCVWQDNGDGNNSLGMCMAYTVLVGVVYTPVFFGLQAASALVGHLVLKNYGIPQMNKE